MMNHLIKATFTYVLLACSSLAMAKELPDFTDIVQESAPAVVKINGVQRAPTAQNLPRGQGGEEIPEIFRQFFDQQPMPRGGNSTGSGFIISADGYVLTNNHVIEEADEISVTLQDRREFTASVVGRDPQSDLALLKVDGSDLPVVRFGDSSQLEVGEWVLAVGSPFGLDYSVAAGIVSAKGRSLPSSQSSTYVPFIQTDVAINPGNSGGPLFNLEGEVVGINSQIYTRSGGSIGLSFAIPAGVALNVVEQLKSKGKVTRGWLGVQIQDVDRELASALGLSEPSGALVSQVLKDGPAAKGGIKEGDVILKFDGMSINEMSDLPLAVGQTEPGKKVPVQLMRDQKRKTIKLGIGSLDDNQVASTGSSNEEAASSDKLGLRLEELNDAEKERANTSSGVMIVAVTPGKAGSDGGLRAGDIITSLHGREVNTLKDYARVLEDLPNGKPIAVRIVRRGQPAFLALTIQE